MSGHSSIQLHLYHNTGPAINLFGVLYIMLLKLECLSVLNISALEQSLWARQVPTLHKVGLFS
jgi:hypothetical protein